MYNDELLSPESYELMAKEYAKSIKNDIRFVKINTDKTKQLQICDNLILYASSVEKYINCLLNIKTLNTNRIKEAKSLQNLFNNYKSSIEELCNKKTNASNIKTNYCDCLTNIIANCLKSIVDIENLKDFYDIEIINKLTDNIIALTQIINKTCSMFGICKFRK